MLPAPLPIMIIEVLKRKGSVMTDRDLHNELSKLLGYEVPLKDFNKALMVLEIRKVVYVETIKKDLRLIHLLDKR